MVFIPPPLPQIVVKENYKISGPLKEVSQTENLKKQMKQDINSLSWSNKMKNKGPLQMQTEKQSSYCCGW